MASEVVCNLCFIALPKGPNRYLVQNKGEFSVQDEISDLEFVVQSTSQYICKICFKNDVVDLTPSGDCSNTISYEADHGRKIVFDNFDFMQKVHHMSEVHQNIDNHWVVHMSTENRVSGNHLSMVEGSAKRILEMDNGKCLPDRNEHSAQRDNYADLVSRILVDNIKCLGFLKAHVIRHIKHPYSRDMTKPTETVCTE